MKELLCRARSMVRAAAIAAVLPVLASGGTALAAHGAPAAQTPAPTEAPAVGGAAQEAPPAAEPTPGAETRAGVVYRIPVTGVVEMGLSPFISRSLREAEAANAAAAVLDIDTPGGRVDAAEQIVDAISDAGVPVVAYVNRRALSAGALIALATDGIYMRPGATIGAATPVTGEGETASEKVVSAMRSAFRSLAEARGLDPRVAEAMVDENIEIPGIAEAGSLLTLSTVGAVELGYAEEVADWEALLSAVGAVDVEVVTTEPNWAERVVRFLTNPLVAPFLLSLGFLGLIIEVKTPSFGLAGAAGLSSLALFFGSHFIIGLAGWEVAILLGLGVLLLLTELLILPGFGVAGTLGGVAIVVSIFLSLVGRMPTTGDIMTAINILLGSILLVGFAAWQIVKRLPEDRRGRNLILQGGLGRELGYESARRRDELVGMEGVTTTDLRPSGSARFGSERIDVVSEGPWISTGTAVRIVRAEGYRHVVEPIDDEPEKSVDVTPAPERAAEPVDGAELTPDRR